MKKKNYVLHVPCMYDPNALLKNTKTKRKKRKLKFCSIFILYYVVVACYSMLSGIEPHLNKVIKKIKQQQHKRNYHPM